MTIPTKSKCPSRGGYRWTPAGSENPSAILTAEKVRDIRRDLLNGASRGSLAIAHGVTLRTIRAVAERQTWAHVE